MTKVIFRKFHKTGDIIALLPEMPANKGMVMSYMHVGQHGEASKGITGMTIPAHAAECEDLRKELTAIYGELNVANKGRIR